MRKSSILWLCCFLIYMGVNAQTLFSTDLQGKVISDTKDVAGVHVLNVTIGKATITNAYGYFSIPAKLTDTLVFSAIQFKRKELVITKSILDSKLVYVPLVETLTELDEVVVTPYNLSGNIDKDLEDLKIEPVVTASTLDLPNAYVKPISQAERHLFEATSGSGLIPLNPIINGISGRTKMLKKRLARNEAYERTGRVRQFYTDSLFVKDLKIPINKIEDFMYFCEVDTDFNNVVDTRDKLKIWSFLQKKSVIYRENNQLN